MIYFVWNVLEQTSTFEIKNARPRKLGARESCAQLKNMIFSCCFCNLGNVCFAHPWPAAGCRRVCTAPSPSPSPPWRRSPSACPGLQGWTLPPGRWWPPGRCGGAWRRRPGKIEKNILAKTGVAIPLKTRKGPFHWSAALVPVIINLGKNSK